MSPIEIRRYDHKSYVLTTIFMSEIDCSREYKGLPGHEHDSYSSK